MSRIAFLPTLLLFNLLVAPAFAQAPVLPGPNSDILRVRTSSAWVKGTLRPLGPDSFQFVPQGAGEPRVIERGEILELQRMTGLMVHPLKGAVVGAVVGTVASSNFLGPIAYGGAIGAVSLLIAAVGATPPDWPDYPQGLLHNRANTVAVGVAAGLVLGIIPRPHWEPIPGWVGSTEPRAVPPIVRPAHRKLGTEIGLGAGVLAGFLAGGGIGDPWHATLLSLRVGAVGGVLGFLAGAAAH